MRRRDAYLTIGFAGAIVFFAAISISVNALAPDVPTTSNAAAGDARVEDSTFVLRLGSTTTLELPQQQLVELGRSVCISFDAGKSLESAVQVLAARGLTSGQATMLIDAAVKAYCPRHLDRLMSNQQP